MIELTLPWPPKELSPNARLHWSKVARAKKAHKEACAWTAMEQGLRKVAAQKLHLSLVFYPPTRRAFDLDNLLARCKAMLDGLAGVMQVDDKHWSLSISKAEDIGGFVKVKIEKVK